MTLLRKEASASGENTKMEDLGEIEQAEREGPTEQIRDSSGLSAR